MAGGWVPAARLPALEAITWADEHIRKERWSAHTQNLQIWASSLGAYAFGGTPPDPPEPPLL